MKFFSAKLLLVPFFALNASIAHANLYRIDLNYNDNNTPTTGTLTGFIVIDSTQFDGQENRTGGNSIELPDWISQASMTLSPTGGGADVTQTTFGRLDWNVSLPAGQTQFDPSADFLSQVTRFGLVDFGDFKGSSTSGPLRQGFDEGEFNLVPPVTSTAVPGPLPLLGLAPLAWYFRKLKKKSIKL